MMRTLLGRLIAALALVLIPTAANAAWHEARSKHFIIYSDDNPERLHDFAVRLEKFDKAVRLVRGMDDPPLTDSRRLTVYVLRNEDAVQQLIGMTGVLGLYEGRAAGSFAFVPRKAGDGSKFDLDAEAVFFHEYAHHLQLQRSSMALPAWFIEGFAEFFATAEFQKDGSVLIGSVPAYRGWGLQNVSAGLSLEQILGGTYKSLDGEKLERLYAQGWLLTHYLTFEPSRKGQLDRYLTGIQKGLGALDSARAAFGELSTLNRELERYKNVRLTAVEVAAKALSTGQIALRPLTPGEAAIMKVHIRSTRGVTERTAPAVAKEARKIAERFPGDAFVQMALAEAELDTENLTAADAAADRAITLKPDFVRALIFKGRAQLALAKKNPAAADWAAVRRWFLRVNKIDTENAEALMLFYETYRAAGQHPTKNAIDGLLYAVDLVPHDEGLRLTAFRQLVSDNRMTEARQVFAPLAFRPHGSQKWRELTDKVLAAIDSGNRSAVLAVLDADKNGKEDE
jgi:tetratricopeptide (TPR) repeat protein